MNDKTKPIRHPQHEELVKFLGDHVYRVGSNLARALRLIDRAEDIIKVDPNPPNDVYMTDLLRASVVLLHATVEDLFALRRDCLLTRQVNVGCFNHAIHGEQSLQGAPYLPVWVISTQRKQRRLR